MPEMSLEVLPDAPYAPLVTFSWGPNVARYCRWTQDLMVGEEIFTHEPSLKVLWDRPQTGGVEDAPVTVQMRSFVPPFDKLSRPFAHAVVHVSVAEANPLLTSDFRELFSGRIRQVTSRPDGQGGVARAQIIGHKSRLNRFAGMQANSTCPWIFGSPPCQFDLPANTLNGTITELSVDGIFNRIIVDVGMGHDMRNERWARGHIEDADGLRISIRRAFDDGEETMELREIPPPEWLNASVSVKPGCNKSIEVCRIHDQEENFGGFGFAAPYYNPTILTS
jgi:hypothetical protein